MAKSFCKWFSMVTCITMILFASVSKAQINDDFSMKISDDSGVQLSEKNCEKGKEAAMQQSTTSLGEIKLIGIKAKTSFTEESKWETGKIFSCVMRYFHEKLFEKIPTRKKPGTTYCVYTDYDSDYRGGYTYFIGEEVSSLDAIPVGLESLIIPSQKYTKFTTNPAPMPDVVKDAWQKIWHMTPADLGGKRLYRYDFEIYDERAADENSIILDLYIGVE